MSAIHPALYRAARSGIYNDSASEIEDTVRSTAEWLADMLEKFAGTYETERAYATGVRGAAQEVRKAGDVR